MLRVFVVIRHQAGKAELKLTIVGPRGNSLPFTMNATALGDHVVYTPRERGPHLIYVTYGGLDVPGRCFSHHSMSLFPDVPNFISALVALVVTSHKL